MFNSFSAATNFNQLYSLQNVKIRWKQGYLPKLGAFEYLILSDQQSKIKHEAEKSRHILFKQQMFGIYKNHLHD